MVKRSGEMSVVVKEEEKKDLFKHGGDNSCFMMLEN